MMLYQLWTEIVSLNSLWVKINIARNIPSPVNAHASNITGDVNDSGYFRQRKGISGSNLLEKKRLNKSVDR